MDTKRACVLGSGGDWTLACHGLRTLSRFAFQVFVSFTVDPSRLDIHPPRRLGCARLLAAFSHISEARVNC